MSEVEQDGETTYSEVRFGWMDYLPALPSPVIAGPGTELWRVMLHGRGFVMQASDSGERIIGFVTTHFVPARTREEAIERALHRARRRWKERTHGLNVTGDLDLKIQEVEDGYGWFRWRSGGGYTFYSTEDSTSQDSTV